MEIRLEKVIEVVKESSSTTSNNEILRIIRTFDVSLMCMFLKKYDSNNPNKRPIRMPRIIDIGILTKLIILAPFPCIMPMKVENKTMT